jgi:protoheme IX farnesyltransferase
MSMTTLSAGRSRAGWLARVGAYVELGKPRIGLLVLLTVVVSHWVACWGQPDPLVMANVLVGTLLIACSASSLNQWLEWRGDARMERTAGRPLPAARLGAKETIVFAAFTVTVGTAYLIFAVRWQTAAWALLNWLLYAWFYTPLKTRTSLSTALGAATGAMPVLIGWSAAQRAYDTRAASLYLILFLWQFPHFMAIAWMYRRQYERAGIKVLSVVDPSGRRAGICASLAALLLLPVSAVPALFVPAPGGLLYASTALVLGLGQLAFALAFRARRDDRAARHLLRASLVYLPALLLGLLLVPWK